MSESDAALSAPGGLRAHWRTIVLVVMALLGAAVLVALIATLSEANHQRDHALELQSHSYEVMILTKTLSGTITRSEASLGRYVLSGDHLLGQLYSDEWAQADDQIDQLRHVTFDNRAQQGRITVLEKAYQARGRELELIARATDDRNYARAISDFYQLRASDARITIDRELNAITVSERALLTARTNRAMAAVGQSSSIAKILSVFGILLVVGAIALGWTTIAVLADRAVARADADAERERAQQLSIAVDAATAELRLQEARLRQVQKMEAVGQLTGGIAHDFNNMLAVVLGGLELARRHLDRDPALARRHLDSATEGADRAAALTRRLLAFSREAALAPEVLTPAAVVAGMTDLLDRTLGDTILLETRDDGCGWAVHTDRHQLENAVLNLAVNARDAMEGQGRLTIVTGGRTLGQGEVASCAAGDYASFAVADTGCGMAPAIAERVFEPFFTTKPVGKGTGLGLSQIFAFVRQAGGGIAIESAEGQGTTVTLFLPRRAEATALAPVPQPAIDAVSASSAIALDILVLEDDPRVLAATMGALEEIGHRAVACQDPRTARAALQAGPMFDLILSDVLMPYRTGPEVVAELTALRPDLAVLFVTGFAGEACEAGDLGGHAVLRKPFTLTALERAITDAMLRERPAPPAQIAAE